ncbi:hypothetical protein TEA_004942 [Camellia sinensis var. sinensis]|uniref:3-beta hydroxysteroid dehydrogenase/isomerase domain-containing protein n=1 Tax=Camellia sinensis var. sinensis TaxID=542762 RepID=A0A4S4EMU4_CAMSN|nr:hypothetical protein TEA_004942 [Camellia sinensis var. sinensis]
MKYDDVVVPVLQMYKASKDAFYIGEKKMSIHDNDIKLTFGVGCGTKPMDISYIDLNDSDKDINIPFSSPPGARAIVIASISQPDIIDMLVKENRKAWGITRQLLVWKGDSKSRYVYFDDIVYLIREELIHNNLIRRRQTTYLHLMEPRRDFTCLKQTYWKKVPLIVLLSYYCIWYQSLQGQTKTKPKLIQPVQLTNLAEAELIEPALNGTLNVLGSCAKNPTVKRVVLTSSVAAVAYNGRPRTSDVIIDETWFSDPESCKENKDPFEEETGMPHVGLSNSEL